MTWGARAAALAGCVLLLVYALPLLAPPATSPASGSGFFVRMFPGVPPWWIAARLVCLVLGAALVARAAPRSLVERHGAAAAPPIGSPAPVAARGVRRYVCYVAFAVAAVHAISALAVSSFSTFGQTMYLLALAAPAVLLLAAQTHTRVRIEAPVEARGAPARTGAVAWTVVVLVAVWTVLRLSDAWHSPRAADAVDMWRTFGSLVRFAESGNNFLVETMDPELPGVTSMPLVFQGLPFLRLTGIEPSFAFVQVVNAMWAAASALGVALLAGAVAGRASAPVAAAVFLWAPATLVGPLNPSTVFLGPLLTVALWILVLAFHRRTSASALAGLGAAAGVAIGYPALVPMTLAAVAATVQSWRRGARVPPLIVATAALTFVAACVPALPDRDAMRAMWSTYAAPAAGFDALQDALLGQVPAVRGATEGATGAAPSAFDVPLATLAAPAAVARTPVRLWGDTLFDPLGAALCAVGIAVALRFVRRRPVYAWPLAALAVALLPGFVSSYDRPSLLRVFALPVPVAVLAALGFSTLAAIVGAGVSHAPALAAALAAAAGGTFVFDFVNPGILRPSAMGLAIRALSSDDVERAVVLTTTDENPFWLYLDTIAAQVPPRPITVLDTERTEALLARPQPPRREELLLWTPAVEETARVKQRVCRQWPTSALYSLSDRTGLTHVMVARPSGHGWVPRLDREQWRVEQCSPQAVASTPVAPAAVPPAERDIASARDLRSLDMSGADLSGADLRGKKLAGALLRGAKLERANLSGADLRGAMLAGADLDGADLGGADLTKADLSGASLEKANLEAADLNLAVFAGANLTDATLARTRAGGADLRGARLEGAVFADAQLVAAKLSKTDLSRAAVIGASFRGAMLDGADLSGADLTRGDASDAHMAGARLRAANLSGLILRDVDLSGADLGGAKLAGADLGGANLARAILVGADLKSARLTDATLTGADLTRAVLHDADLSGADLTGAVLSDTELTGTSIVGAKLDGLTLSGANLTGAALSGLRMRGAKLAGTVLAGADLHGCVLSGADLSGADLKKANLAECALDGAVLRGAALAGADLRGTVFDGADLEGAALAEADLGAQRMRGAKLKDAMLARSNLASADLRDSDLQGADLRDAALAAAKLAGADVRGARLGGAMMSEADLTGANLEGADLDRAYLIAVVWSRTRCPDGSLSSDHGETCCGHHRGAAPDSCSP